MLFEKRIERAMSLQREKSGKSDEEQSEQQLSEEMEKGDGLAMIISSFLMLFLPAVAVLIVFVLLCCFLFGLL